MNNQTSMVNLQNDSTTTNAAASLSSDPAAAAAAAPDVQVEKKPALTKATGASSPVVGDKKPAPGEIQKAATTSASPPTANDNDDYDSRIKRKLMENSARRSSCSGAITSAASTSSPVPRIQSSPGVQQCYNNSSGSPRSVVGADPVARKMQRENFHRQNSMKVVRSNSNNMKKMPPTVAAAGLTVKKCEIDMQEMCPSPTAELEISKPSPRSANNLLDTSNHSNRSARDAGGLDNSNHSTSSIRSNRNSRSNLRSNNYMSLSSSDLAAKRQAAAGGGGTGAAKLSRVTRPGVQRVMSTNKLLTRDGSFRVNVRDLEADPVQRKMMQNDHQQQSSENKEPATSSTVAVADITSNKVGVVTSTNSNSNSRMPHTLTNSQIASQRMAEIVQRSVNDEIAATVEQQQQQQHQGMTMMPAQKHMPTMQMQMQMQPVVVPPHQQQQQMTMSMIPNSQMQPVPIPVGSNQVMQVHNNMMQMPSPPQQQEEGGMKAVSYYNSYDNNNIVPSSPTATIAALTPPHSTQQHMQQQQMELMQPTPTVATTGGVTTSYHHHNNDDHMNMAVDNMMMMRPAHVTSGSRTSFIRTDDSLNKKEKEMMESFKDEGQSGPTLLEATLVTCEMQEENIRFKAEQDIQNRMMATVATAEIVESETDPMLVKDETNAVKRSKLVVLLVLGLVAFTMCLATYLVSKNEQKRDAKTHFKNYVSEIEDMASKKVLTIVDAMDSLSHSIASYATQTNATWPYITHPDFETLGKYARKISGSNSVTFSPFIFESKRESWQNYSKSNQDWIINGLKAQGYEYPEVDPIDEHIYYADQTYYKNLDGSINYGSWCSEKGGNMYSPVWQTSPATLDTSYVNFNLMRHPKLPRFIKGTMSTKRPTLSSLFLAGKASDQLEVLRKEASLFDGNYNNENENNDNNNDNNNRELRGGAKVNPYEEQFEDGFPHSMIFHPVFEFKRGEKPVGVVSTVFPWDGYFGDVLNEDVEGVVVVADDSCGGQFTFEVNGPNVDFLGLGDAHDTKYNKLMIEYEFGPSLKTNCTSYDSCEHTLRFYPSDDFMNLYTSSSSPTIYTVIVALLFTGVAIALVVYDKVVERRQAKIQGMAIRTRDIVSSMFPGSVGDRVIAEVEAEEAKKLLKNNGDDDTSSTKDASHNTSSSIDRQPIVNRYHNCTVMWAEIDGFQSWCSSRDPADILTLLGVVFGAMDAMAKRQEIFKVEETSGGTYVAVAGIPTTNNEDSAVQMANFAWDCMRKMEEILETILESQLGPGTTDLTLRIGLHSGPVTAGILRNDRSRFQLFGDTMNMSHQLAFSGQPDRILVSQETATQLMEAGKNEWLTPNKNNGDTKGGKEKKQQQHYDPQTYWLDALSLEV